MTRTQVATALATSAEYYYAYVGDQYLRLLHRPADSSGLPFWANGLVNRLLRSEDFQANLVGSSEYWNNLLVARGTVTILDEDTTVTITAPDPNAAESEQHGPVPGDAVRQ